jgi:hypothetical protein
MNRLLKWIVSGAITLALVYGLALVKPYFYLPEAADSDPFIAGQVVTINSEKFIVIETKYALAIFPEKDKKNMVAEARKKNPSLQPSRFESTANGVLIQTQDEKFEVSREENGQIVITTL